MLHSHTSGTGTSVSSTASTVNSHKMQQQKSSNNSSTSIISSSSLTDESTNNGGVAASTNNNNLMLDRSSCQRWSQGIQIYAGLLAYRGLLCVCNQQHNHNPLASSASAPVSASASSTSSPAPSSRSIGASSRLHVVNSAMIAMASDINTTNGTDTTTAQEHQQDEIVCETPPPSTLLTSYDLSIRSSSTPGSVFLLSADEIEYYHSSRMRGESLGSHSSRCQLVLVTTHASPCSLSEVQARLEFGLLLRSKLYDLDRNSELLEPHHRHLADGRWALIISDPGGDLLSEIESQHYKMMITTKPQQLQLDTIERALQIILDISIQLGALHSLSFVHKNLTPQSILLNETTHQAVLLGLFSASLLQTDKADVDQSLSEHPSESWIYLSAEQSGKSNRRIDQRSDLYSLGVILYELLVGYPPFQSDDLLTLIHMHLAKAPPPIITADMTPESHPQIYYPLTIASSIAMKLLNKQAEDRYQSTAGLISDLRAVLDLMRRGQSNALASFQIGLTDSNSTFRLSQRLYGREVEVRALIKAYQSIARPSFISSSSSSHVSSPSSPTSPYRSLVMESPVAGGDSNVTQSVNTVSSQSSGSGSPHMKVTRLRVTEDTTSKHIVPHLFLISGFSGAGKTSLVEELHKYIVQNHGLYCRTKFDLLKREASCILQAFRSLILHFLMGDALKWKVKLLRALGTNARVLCDVMPELSRLIGPENAPPVSKLSAAENANRFNMVFSRFVAALTTSSTPLALFIDDLQWADSGSLALLSLLLKLESSHLLIIGAYRSNEVDASHPLTTFMQQQQADRMTSVILKPLTHANITQLLTDSFKCTPESAQLLVDLLFIKTNGNALYIGTLLRSWYEAKLLHFDFDQARWRWKIDEMRLTAIHADVVDVICQQMQCLSSAAQQLLTYASCLGHVFSLHTLSVVTTLPLDQLMLSARDCEQAGFLICQTHGHDFVLLSERSSPSQQLLRNNDAQAAETQLNSQLQSIIFKFAHDRIQTAAYRLIPASELSRYHFVIARQLLLTYDESERSEYCVEISNHVMTGCGLGELTQPTESLTEKDQQMWNEFFQTNNGAMYQTVLELCGATALHAKAASAYENAIRYIIAALQLLQQKANYFKSLKPVPTAASHEEEEKNTSKTDDNANKNEEAVAAAAASSSSSRGSGGADESTTSSPEFYSVDAECWSCTYPCTLRCYVELCQCLFLNSNFNLSERCTRYVFAHATSLNDRSLLMETHLFALNGLLRYQDSLDAGLSYLSQFGIVLLGSTTPEIEEWLWRGIDPSDESTYSRHPVFLLEEISNPLLLTLISALSPAVFFLSSPLFYNIAVTGVYITMKHGVSTDSAFVMSLFAMCLWGTEYKKNYALGRITKTLLKRYGESGRQAQARLAAVVNGVIYPWNIPIRKNLRYVELAWDDGLAIYDYEWVSYLALHLCEHPFICNLPQTEICTRLKQLRSLLLSRGLVFSSLFLQNWLTLTEELLCIELTHERDLTDAPKPGIIEMGRQGNQAIRDYFARRMEEAIVAFELANRPTTAVPGFISTSNYCFYHCLALLESIPIGTVTLGETSIESTLPVNYNSAFTCERLAQADAQIARMVVWCDLETSTFVHKRKLMKAQRNSVAIFSHLGMHALMMPTIQLYEESIEGAIKNNFNLEAAVAMELLSRFYTSCHRTSLAQSYIRQAYSMYTQCDLILKLKQLVIDYPHIEFEKSTAQHSLMPYRGPAPNASSVPLRMRQLGLRRQSSAGVVASTSSPPIIVSQPPQQQPQQVSHISGSSSSFPINIIPPSSSTNDAPLSSSSSSSSASVSSFLPDLGGATATDILSVLRSTSTFSTEVDQSKLLKRIMRIVLETAGATRGALVLRQQQDEWCVELSASVEIDEQHGVGGGSGAGKLDEVREEDDTKKSRSSKASESKDGKSDAQHSLIESPESPADRFQTVLHDAAGQLPILTSGNTVNISDGSSHSSSSSTTSGSFLSHLDSAHHQRSASTVNQPRIRIASSHKISDAVPVTIFHYVLNSQETVLLVDPSSTPEFAAFSRDPYFAYHRPKCILCMPILKASKVFGVLYLENQFDSTAFSTSHIQLLHHLCTQAALSIDNARLYNQLSEHNAKLEEQVGERTRELEVRNTQLTSAKDEAEKATKAKSQFLSNMSHEIRTPMNAVLGVSRLLAETHLSLEQQQYLAMITNSGHLLLTIINDILDYSKIEAGELKLNLAPHNIVDTVETAVLLCYEMSAAKNLNLTWFIDPSLPSLLCLDATRVQQILLNLLSNAIKFTKVGSVELRVIGRPVEGEIYPAGSTANQTNAANGDGNGIKSPLTVTRSSNANAASSVHSPAVSSTPTSPAFSTMQHYELEFHVTDTGIGLTPAHIQTLFKSFSQVQHMSGEYGGTGLGLAISAKLAEKHGGNITVASQFGHGSTFIVKLRSSIPSLRNSIPYRVRRLTALGAASSSQSSSKDSTPRMGVTTIKAAGSSGLSSPSAVSHSLASHAPPQIHGMAPHEVDKLRSRLMYIGQNDAFARSVRDMLLFYHAEIESFQSIETAHLHLMQVHNASLPTCDAILVDLDSRDSITKEIITEEQMRERLLSLNLPSMRILLMYSRAHLGVSTDEALVSSRALPRSQSNSVPLLSSSVSMSLRSLHLAQASQPQSPIVNDETKAVSATITQPFVPHLPFTDETSETSSSSSQPSASPTSIAVTVGSSPAASSSSSIPSASPTVARSSLTAISLPAISSAPLIRRIKKPWKAKHFLSLLVALLDDAPLTPSPNPTPPSGDQQASNTSFPITDVATNTDATTAVSSATLIPSSSAVSAATITQGTSSSSSSSTSSASSIGRNALKPKIANLSRTHPLRILLAEDNLTNQKLMVMVMRKLGYELLIASNGAEVLDLLERESKKGKSHEIECIVMDASMDVMDGMECTRLIRAQQLPHRTRPFIIAQTANVTDEYRAKCLESGMDRFSVKPIHVEELVKCLKAAYEAVQHQQQAQTMTAQ